MSALPPDPRHKGRRRTVVRRFFHYTERFKMYNGITIPEIVQALSDRMEDLVCALGLEGRVDNNDFVAYNPTRQDNHLGSFRICIRGAKRGIWQEFAGSDKGDALELINYCRYGGTKDKTQAIRWARNFLGMNAMNRAELRRLQMQSAERRRENAIREMNDRQQKKKWAQSIFFNSQTGLLDTPVDAYLLNRRIDLRRLGKLPHSLRFDPDCFFKPENAKFPAMIAAITGADNQIMAVHRTFLEKKGGVFVKKEKLVLGAYAGGVIRLWRGDTGASLTDLQRGNFKPTKYSGTLLLTEGIEDALSVAMACPQYRIWTTISIGNAANIQIPDCFDTVIFCADNDEPGSKAWAQCNKAAAAIKRQGKIVKIARSTIGKDFNDQLRA